MYSATPILAYSSLESHDFKYIVPRPHGHGLMALPLPLPPDGEDSDREGSLTPTNEAPPTLEFPEEPTTPKDEASVSIVLAVCFEKSLKKAFCSLRIEFTKRVICQHITSLELLNKGRIDHFVLCREFFLSSEVKNLLAH